MHTHEIFMEWNVSKMYHTISYYSQISIKNQKLIFCLLEGTYFLNLLIVVTVLSI